MQIDITKEQYKSLLNDAWKWCHHEIEIETNSITKLEAFKRMQLYDLLKKRN